LLVEPVKPRMPAVPLDRIAAYNQERWDELSREGVTFGRPWLDLTREEAIRRIDPEGIAGDVRGRDVLCLAASGGQQSAAFGVLGARVTVFDLSGTQLEKDRAAAARYGFAVSTEQGDMRDLSRFPPASFDLVWLAHGINFVPDARRVIGGAVRVLREGGLLRLECTNPYVHGAWDAWNGEGYLLRAPFADGGEVTWADPDWVFEVDGREKRMRGPREFRHALSTIVNALVAAGMTILGLWEAGHGDAAAAPGSWRHFVTVAPPWITVWARAAPREITAAV
jgi:SAM-dependent methyltransferase